MTSDPSRQSVSAEVRSFYEQMPFNYYSTSGAAVESVARNPIEAYPDLDALLEDDAVATVLEVGCGAGWASNSVALHYGKRVTAVDMTAKALERAAEVSRLTGTAERTRFIHTDLFDFETSDRFDLVMSIGVLHHTFDCRKAFRHVARFVAPDQYLFIGLYHLYGRRAFLSMFWDILEKDGEEAAFQRYRQLNPLISDETHLRSWFRDQVLHPQETQHTLEEVAGWLAEDGFSLISTSINRFEEVDDLAAVIGLERDYEALSQRRNEVENSYFPGFFTILAQRNPVGG